MKSQLKKFAALFLSLCVALSIMTVASFADTSSTSYYEKVTTAPSDWSGDYLIVYEKSSTEATVFNGGASTLDAEKNHIAGTIADGKIEATDAMNAAKVTIAKKTGGYSIKAAVGKYIGNSKDQNKLENGASDSYTNTITLNADKTVAIVSSGTHLRFNSATTANNNRFRYYKAATYTGQKAIALYKLVEAAGGDASSEESSSEASSEASSDVTSDTSSQAPAEPANGTTLTIAEAIALGQTKESNSFTTNKYFVEGKITEVYNTTFGNMKITDDAGNILTIYGTYTYEGGEKVRYDAMTVKPVAGDTVKLEGVIGQYNGNSQMKDGVVVALQQAPKDDTSSDVTSDTSSETPAPETSTIVVIDAPKAGVAYKFGMIQKNVSDTTVYFLKGGMDGYYMATADAAAQAIDVYLEETTGGYYFYTMVDGAKKYINMVVSGTHVNGAYEDTAATVYTYSAADKTIIATVNDAPYWFGTRNDKTYTTVGPCATSYQGFYCQFYGAPATDDDDTSSDVTSDVESDITSDVESDVNSEGNNDEDEKEEGKVEAPDAGDHSSIAIFVLMMLLAGAAFVASRKRV